MHQVVWAKLLVQLIGATAHAQATVLAVFMGGLAIGAVWIGRRVDRLGRPLRTYVVLEFAIAAICLALPLLIDLAGMGYVFLATRLFESAGLKLLLRGVLAVLVVLLPAILMGGTLPALARHLIGGVEETQRNVARLYSLNSFGAVLGAGTAGFVTLPLLGIYGSLVLASLLNVAAGALLLGHARRESKAAPTRAAKPAHKPRPATATTWRREQYSMALAALALSGFAAMAYEVLFTRIIALSFGASTYSFSVMLMCFIAGIALGSAIAARRRVRDPLWWFGVSQLWFGVSQLAVVVALLLATPLVSRLPYLIGLLRIGLQEASSGFALFQFGKAALCLLVLLAPTACLGLGFPLVAQIQVRQPDRVGGPIGSTYAWNTIGNVLGAISTSVLLLPTLGLLGSFHLSLACNALAGLGLLLVCDSVPLTKRLGAVGVTAAVGSVYLLAGLAWPDPINLGANHLSLRTGPQSSLDPRQRAMHPASSFESWKRTYVAGERDDEVLYFGEDSHTTVLVVEARGRRMLYVNGKPDASTTVEDLETQLLVAHAPLFLAPEAGSVLVIGHGSGITLGSALSHPIESVDVVEISRSVIEADASFAGDNFAALSDPRVRVYEEDGQSFLRTTPRRYDLIISEPSNPWMAGVSDLFTVDFFEAARDRLEPGGVFTFWFHTYFQSDEMVRLVFRTLASVFPNCLAFSDDDAGNLVVLASLEPLRPDFAAMERRFERPRIRTDLARLGMPSLLALLTHHRFSERDFRKLLEWGPLNTAARQRLEYAAPRSFFHNQHSFIVERQDPLIQGRSDTGDLLLDRYLSWRSLEGRPVSRDELVQAARYAHERGGYGPKVARAVLARER